METENSCEQCGELWDSEYHINDECVNLNVIEEDID